MKSLVIAGNVYRSAGMVLIVCLGFLVSPRVWSQSVDARTLQPARLYASGSSHAGAPNINRSVHPALHPAENESFPAALGPLGQAARKVSFTGKIPAVLTTVAQVRSLTPQQASSHVPVLLHGVVTVLSGYKNSFFMQDAATGISVDRTDHADVHVGDTVEITGVSGAGLFAPVVIASSVRVNGPSVAPLARHMTYGDLIGGAQDSQWIEIQGVVHSARMVKNFGHETLQIIIDLGGGSVRVLLQDYAGIDYSHLVDATLRLRGVSSTTFNEKRQFVGVGLYVPEQRDMEVLQPAPDDPFLAPATPVRNALQFGQMPHRVKIAGIATYQIPGQALYLQEGADGIKIQTASRELIAPGKRVEVLGFPVMGEYAPFLEDGLLRVDDGGAPVKPLRIADAKSVIVNQFGFLQAPYDQQLVQIEGTVVENHTQGDQRVWILRQHGEVFEAYLPLAADAERLADLSSGSTLLLTGICIVHTNSNREPVSFSILLRSSRDAVILRTTPWWTPGHTLLLLTALAGFTLLVTLWVVVLRSRVQKQTRIIRESEERFRNLAQLDVLTGLPNRLMLEERILQCLTLCASGNRKAAFFTIDIDRFKNINDTYGHLVADECLKTVAARLIGGMREGDTIARTGGEEFTLVAAGLTGAEGARRIAAAFLDLFKNPIVVPGHEIILTVSIGAALYPDDGLDSKTLQRRSDQALYEAKRTGRNRAVFATKALAESSEQVTSIENSLRETLGSGGFSLHYQALCDGKGAIRRFEALLRTTDERLRKAGLAKFIPIAEESGLIVPLGRWVLEEACRQIAEWQSLGLATCQVAVNISARQLLHRGFADEVLATLARFRVDPALVQLELTETTVMTELAPVAETVARLARAGLAFAIDDFGTGYSSLSRLRELPIKTLKIDRSFVQSLERDGGSYSIILAIVQMAKSLHVQVVAEGVETLDQFTILKEMGCDLFQGYLFARPVDAASAIQALAESRAEVLAGTFVGIQANAALSPVSISSAAM